MKNLKSLLLILALLFALSTSGQTFYRLYGNTNVNEGGISIIASPDGNILTAGYKNDSALVMKTDLSGNMIWIRTFKPVSGGNNIIHQITITPDGYIAGIGNALVSGIYGDMFHFKMDIAGNLIWLNRVIDTRRIFAESIVPKTANEYVIIADVYDLNSTSSADVITYRVNAATGAVISNTPRLDYVPSNSHIDDPYSATLNSAGNRIYTTGRIYVNGAPPDGMRPYLTKLDLNGNHLSTAYLGWTAAQSARIYGTDLVYNNDSVAICYFGDVAGSSSNFTVGLIRTDTAGNIAWSKNYNITSTGSEIASKVIATPTGYFIVGYTIGGTNDFFIIATSMNGALLWAKSYGGATSTESFLVTTSPVAGVINNQIYFTGHSLSGTNRDLVIASADMSGNISCITVNNLVITTTNNPVNRTVITPAAIPEILNFSSGGVATIQPIPDACSVVDLNLGNDTSTCTNYTLNATLPSATSYLWNNGSTAPTLVTNSSGTYWVTVTINCCIYNDTIIITSAQAPQAGFTSVSTGCNGTINFTNTSAGASSHLWNFGDNTTDTTTSPNHTYSTPGTYTVTLVSTSNCGNDTIQSIVTVPPFLSMNVSPTSVLLCSGDSVLLTAMISGGTGSVSYSWSSGGSGASTNVAPTSSSTFIITVTDSLGCTAQDTAIVNVIPPIALSATGGTTICAGQSVALSAVASNGGPYTWSNNLGNSSNVTVSPSVSTTYYVTVYDSCSGLSLIDSVSVFVMPPSVVQFTLDSTSGCAPLTVYFTDLSTTPQDVIVGWIWSFGDGDSSSLISPSHTYTTSGTYSVTLTVITSSGCGTTLINGAIVDVYPNPIAGFTWQQTSSGGNQPEVQFTDESVGATSWQWLLGDSTNSTEDNPIHTYGQPGSYSVVQIVSNDFGCTDTAYAELLLTGEFTLYVPNTFTPGSGTNNNTFGGIGTGIATYHIMIFDRWGMLIFESSDYYLQWDGTFKGNRVQIDTYVWVIVATDYLGGEHNLIGHVNVIR